MSKEVQYALSLLEGEQEKVAFLLQHEELDEDVFERLRVEHLTITRAIQQIRNAF